MFQELRLSLITIRFYKVPNLPFIVPSEEQFFDIDYDGLDQNGWILKSKSVLSCLEKMRCAASDNLA